MTDSYVSTTESINLTGASPDFTRNQFLAHSQTKVNEALNEYAVNKFDVVANAQSLGVANKLFGRSTGETMTEVLEATQLITEQPSVVDVFCSNINPGPVLSCAMQLINESTATVLNPKLPLWWLVQLIYVASLVLAGLPVP